MQGPQISSRNASLLPNKIFDHSSQEATTLYYATTIFIRDFGRKH